MTLIRVHHSSSNRLRRVYASTFSSFNHTSFSLTTMPPKRRKRSPPPNEGLAPGESLQRYLAPRRNTQSALWTWVGSEAADEADISSEHCLMVCGLSARNNYPFCANKHTALHLQKSPDKKEEALQDNDIIIVSDDEDLKCTKKSCKVNPNCLNYLGQDMWEDKGESFNSI